jgi:hypothetical protein
MHIGGEARPTGKREARCRHLEPAGADQYSLACLFLQAQPEGIGLLDQWHIFGRLSVGVADDADPAAMTAK